MKAPVIVRRRQGAFTFVEILLAVLITGLVMSSLYGLLVSTIEVKELVQRELDEEKAGALAFDMIRRDLQAACRLSQDKFAFKSDRGEGALEGSGRIDFVASVRNRFPDATAGKARGDDRDALMAMRCDLCEIGYRLETIDDEQVLLRREDFYVDDDLEKGGVTMKLCRRVKAFDLQFYTGLEADSGDAPREEWDAEEEEALPLAVKVRLVLDRSKGEDDEAEKVFEAIIPLFAGKRQSDEDQDQ